MPRANRDIPIVADAWFYDMKIGQLREVLGQTLDQVRKRWDGVLHSHVCTRKTQRSEGLVYMIEARSPLPVAHGLNRKAVFLMPIALLTDSTSSSGNLARFSMEPPYSSVR